jgi:inorganic pyrophosphatase
MWFNGFLKLFYTLIIVLFSQIVIADDNNCANKFTTSLNFKKLEKIEINTIENRKFQSNNLKILIDPRKSILPKFKKKYLSNLLVIYSNGDRCQLKAFIRQNGDMRDHIRFVNGKIHQSLDVSLVNGNINGIVKFKLLLEDTRGIKEDEVIITELLREIGFISPRTSLVETKINNAFSTMIFQEKSVKEMLEFNFRREGPILEGNEKFMFMFQSEILRDGTAQYKKTYNAMERGVGLQLARLSNSNWSMKSQNHFKISFNALSLLNKIYLTFLSNYKNKINNFDFQGYSLSNEMLGMGNVEHIKKLNFFNILLHAAGADHGLLPHNRKFYWNSVMNFFEPIYYDGTLDFNKNIANQAFSANMWLPYHGDLLQDHNLLIKKLQIIDIDKLFKKLEIKNIGIDKSLLEKKINTLVENIKNSHKNIQNADEELVKFNKDISFNIIYKNNFIKNLKENNFNSKFVKILNQDEDILVLEKCDVITNLCENKVYNFYNLDDRAELRTIMESNFENKNFFYEIDPLVKTRDPNIQIAKIQNTDLIYSNDVEINYDDENNILNILQKKEGSRVFFKNGKLTDININFIGNASQNNLVDFPIDKFGNTGCITFVNIEFSNVSLSSQNSNCEDAVNIIRSKGKIKNINISNSISDALDIDFSQISIDKAIITNSKNDCSDFSMGNYNINELITEFCGDKSISVGENSIFTAKKINSKFSNIALATKDSSHSFVDFIEIYKTKYCIAAYNKKQEFAGGKIEINEINCIDYFDETFLDDVSTFKAKNKNFKTLIKKKELQINTDKNLIINTPAQDENGNVFAIIEIPKDTNEKWEISKIKNKLEIDFDMGKPRIIDYGNYISNYGIIPRTYFSPRLGGDGDPLDVLVFGDKLKRGEVVKIYPIGLIRMTDFGENDFKIIAIKLDDYQKTIDDNDIFNSLNETIENNKNWLSNYKGSNFVKFLNYGNSKDAINLINITNKEFNKYGIKSF